MLALEGAQSFEMVRLHADSLRISEIISLNLLLFQAFVLSVMLCFTS